MVIRNMDISEAKEVQKVGRRAFCGMELIFLGKPKEAMVAVKDDKIVGAMTIKYLKSKGKKHGNIDFAFVDKKYHGDGVGRALYKKTIKYMWDQGCTTISALVKADNVASWKLLINNGLSRVTLLEAIKKVGVGVITSTPSLMSNGMEIYLASKDDEVVEKKVDSLKQIATYFILNLLLVIPVILLGNIKSIGSFLLAYNTLLLGTLIIGYLGTIITKRKFNFRVNSCGGLVSAFVNLSGGALYPLVGDWYPKKYENNKVFKKDLGIIALVQWIFIVIATLLAFKMQAVDIFYKYLFQIGYVFSIFRVIAIYPFDEYGGARVFRWNKLIYLIMAIISIFIVYI